MKTNVINTPVSDFTSVNTEERKELQIRAGDTVRVWVKIKEKDNKGKEKVRIQAFEGLVVGTKHGNEAGATFTVRKISYGVGIERIFPLFSPMVDKIEVLKKGSVRKSKLYFVREKVTKEIKRLTRRAKLVGLTTSSDIAETERKIKEAEESAKKVEEEAAAKAAAEAETKAAEEAKTKEAEAPKEEVKTEEVAEEKKD